MRAILLSLVFLTLNGYAQSPLEIYVKSEFYREHLAQANQVYQELMEGKVGPALQLFIDDTTWGEGNKLYIDTIFRSEGFMVAKMLDTLPVPGTAPIRYTTEVAFRKISEFQDGEYDWYRLWVGFFWNKKLETFGRKIVFRQSQIRSKKDWKRTMWKYPAPNFLPEE